MSDVGHRDAHDATLVFERSPRTNNREPSERGNWSEATVGLTAAPVTLNGHPASFTYADATGRPNRSWPSQAVRGRTEFIRRAALPICDAFSLCLAALLTVGGWTAVAYGAAVLILLRCNGWQRLRICLRLSDQVACLVVAAALPIPLFLFFMNQATLLRLAVSCCGLLITTRLALYTLLRAAHRRKLLTERVLIIGSGELGIEIWQLLEQHPELGLTPIGFIDDPAPDRASSLPLPGGMSELPDLVSTHNVHRIIVTCPEGNDAALTSTLLAGQQLQAEVCVVPRMHELAAAIPASCQDDIWGIPLIPLRPSGLRWSSRIIKRTFDIVVSTMLLLISAPLLALLIGAVLVSSGRPVFFRQERVTRSGRIMKITKLRTVKCAASDGRWTVSLEDCSAVGRWLRTTHLDELPQLLNVVRGDMSLVGPRPERPYFTAQFAETIPRYEDRHRMNAGLTGWAQVHGLSGDTSIYERARFDNNYIEHWSLWLDLVILIRTLGELPSGIRRRPRARDGRQVISSTRADQGETV
jgi:exopolysaccharide biosynthesis polyprenyl glycosylphosphotransferase